MKDIHNFLYHRSLIYYALYHDFPNLNLFGKSLVILIYLNPIILLFDFAHIVGETLGDLGTKKHRA